MIDYSTPLNAKLRKDNAFKSPLFLNIIYFVNINKKEFGWQVCRSMGVNAYWHIMTIENGDLYPKSAK